MEECGHKNSALEAAIIRAMSSARTYPRTLHTTLSSRLQHYKGKDYYPPERGGKVAVPSKEGKSAVQDALSFLEKQPPLPPLREPDGRGLELSAEDHLIDRGTLGLVGHIGSDGSRAADRQARYGVWSGKCGECLWFGREGVCAETIVADLVVDDGVRDRGHRLCIFDGRYLLAAARVGFHATYGWMAVIEFAEEYRTESEAATERIANGAPSVHTHRHEASNGSSETAWNLGDCCRCKQAIRGGAVVDIPAIGKFHRGCFACMTCSKALVAVAGGLSVPWKGDWTTPGSSLIARSEGILCEACYADKFALSCSVCAIKLMGGVFRIKGKPETYCSKACCETKKHQETKKMQAGPPPPPCLPTATAAATTKGERGRGQGGPGGEGGVTLWGGGSGRGQVVGKGGNSSTNPLVNVSGVAGCTGKGGVLSKATVVSQKELVGKSAAASKANARDLAKAYAQFEEQ